MTNASIDMFTASSIMVLVLLASFYGVSEVAQIYLGRNPETALETSREVARYLLLNPGEPGDWGVESSSTPTRFGLAKEGSEKPYSLDIDKVSRLYPESIYVLNYADLWEALGVNDLSFRIELECLFNVSLSLVSTVDLGDSTRYTFSIDTSNGGLPLSADVKCYVVVRNFVTSNVTSTNGNGEGEVSFTLSNSLSGGALLIALARTEMPLLSFGVLQFGHKSSVHQNGYFVTLSPLNHTLYVNTTYTGETIIGASVFTYHYYFSLTETVENTYSIPRLLDPSPMVLAVTGLNGTEYFAEWITYPPIPLEVGTDTALEYTISGFSSQTYIVEISGVQYKFRIILRRPGV